MAESQKEGRMSPKEINLAIAELCGVETVSDGWLPSYSNPDNHNLEQPAEPLPIPNYCEDLNAMREAEATLTLPARKHYTSKLLHVVYRVVGRDYLLCEWRCDYFLAAHATAAQRAEAFLRLHERWKK